MTHFLRGSPEPGLLEDSLGIFLKGTRIQGGALSKRRGVTFAGETFINNGFRAIDEYISTR